MTDLPDIETIRAMREKGNLPNYIRRLGGIKPRPRKDLEIPRCRICGAPPMQSCSTPQGKPLRTAGIHETRVQDAMKLQAAQQPHNNEHRPGSWPVTRSGQWPNK